MRSARAHSRRAATLEHELAPHLGEDLTVLIATLDDPVVEVHTITGLPANGLGRATFRLVLASGRVVKGRRLDALADALRIRAVVTALARPELPRILGQHGNALLEEWIEGKTIAPGTRTGRARGDRHGDCDPAFLERCGRLLGAIHATPVPDGFSDGSSWARRAWDPEAHRSRLEWSVGELIQAGALSSTTAVEVRAVAGAHLPREVPIGFVHRDFCAENLVRGRGCGDAPFVVDSGSVGIDALDLDLARTWYRWPLRAADRQAFEKGYREHRDPSPYVAHFPFWVIAVLTDAALFRIRARAARANVPLRRLERLVTEMRRGHIAPR